MPEFVVVANRLPVDMETLPDGTTEWKASPGGLVTALAPMLRGRGGAWVGWPGVPDEAPEPFEDDGLALHPVPLSAQDVEDYYEGFSNGTLWPLYHDVVAPPEFHRHWWQAYVKVNERFADAVAEVADENATVWVQDYQLQLVPAALRERRPDLRIGFFLHIPFPPTELFLQLPWRKRIIEGLLGADLVGFHTPGGARNFRALATRLADARTERGELHHEGRSVKVGAFPISIDAGALDELARSPEVQERAKEIRADLGDPERVILGVDRLDYTKGINVRLRAFEELLNEGDADDAVMIQIATPSRERVEHYQRLRADVEQAVGRINGEHSRVGHPVLHYLHQSLPREQLAAFFAAADVMLVTPLRDGMNLVAKEYVASRPDLGGVLVLSEFTGAAAELKDALLINPHDIDGLKAAIKTAFSMPRTESSRRMRSLRRQVLTHDVDRWAHSFLDALGLPEVIDLAGLAAAPELLVALDFDGTLAPIVAVPADARALPAALDAIHGLAALPSTTVVLVSGRALADLAAVSGLGPPVRLIGSHGLEPDDDPVPLDDVQRERLDRLNAEVDALVDGAPGVRTERKPAGVAVHVRGAAPDVGTRVLDALREGPAAAPGIVTTPGKAVLDLAVTDVNKGIALDRMRGGATVFFAGDDVTDETAFALLRRGDVGVKVGDGDTAATHRVPDPAALAALLQELLAARS